MRIFIITFGDHLDSLECTFLPTCITPPSLRSLYEGKVSGSVDLNMSFSGEPLFSLLHWLLWGQKPLFFWIVPGKLWQRVISLMPIMSGGWGWEGMLGRLLNPQMEGLLYLCTAVHVQRAVFHPGRTRLWSGWAPCRCPLWSPLAYPNCQVPQVWTRLWC